MVELQLPKLTARVRFPSSPPSSVALPDTEEISEGIWAIALPTHGESPPYNLCYAVVDDDGDLLLLDPGVDAEDNWIRLQHALAHLGKTVADVHTVAATHMHADHLGMGERIRAASGGQLLLHAAEARAANELREHSLPLDRTAIMDRWGVPATRREVIPERTRAHAHLALPQADGELHDGERLPVPGRELRVIHTPGHTSGHVCVREAGAKVVFTGDHVLPTINSGLGLGGDPSSNPVADYLRGLAQIAEFDDHDIAPGHEYPFRGLQARCEAITAHQLRRSREVRDVLAQVPTASVWEVASRLHWSAGWNHLSSRVLPLALRQTEMHVEFVRSGEAEQYLSLLDS